MDYNAAAKVAKTDTETQEQNIQELEHEKASLREKVISLNGKLDDIMEELERVTNALHEAQNRKAIFYDDEARGFLPMVHKGVWNL